MAWVDYPTEYSGYVSVVDSTIEDPGTYFYSNRSKCTDFNIVSLGLFPWIKARHPTRRLKHVSHRAYTVQKTRDHRLSREFKESNGYLCMGLFTY